MSELRSALDGFLVVDDATLSDDQLVADLDEVERASRQLDVVRARRLAELERRELWSRDGHLSLVSWLASRHGVAPSTAAGHVRMARALEAMPVTAESLASGEVSPAAVSLLAAAREAAPEEFARAEQTLVDAARTLPVMKLRDTVAGWREHADAERGDHDEARHERRAVSTVVTLEGMVESTVKLAPSDGQVYLAAIRAAEDTEVRSLNGPDPRTPGQRRADALVQVCRHYLDAQDRPVVAGERPHVIVTIDVESLGNRDENAPGTARSAGARLADIGAISAEEALMWACDAQVTRVITDAASRPLDVGRTTRITPPWIRKALLVRDGGCAFPDCGRPQSWCDPHHAVHWANGGPTALSNLVLLCRRHHRLTHHKRFSVEIVDGLPRFYRTDGTVLDTADRAPP